MLIQIAKEWSSISILAKDLIDSLLEVDYNNRYSALEALNHPWIVQNSPAPDDDICQEEEENEQEAF